jgi:probable HAF family extracellular repeat protein
MKSRLGSFIPSFATAFALAFSLLSAASGQPAYTAGAIPFDVCCSAGNGINAYGDITGVYGSGPDSHAFIYSPSGEILDLGAAGGHYSYSRAINASDEVTGDSTVDLSDVDHHAFLYSGGKMKDLGTLGGSGSWGMGINASGDVVGYSAMSGDTVWHAFLYSGGTMKDLGTLGGWGNSFALAINDSGEITGSSNGHVFLYSGGTMHDLGINGEGTAINDFGEIAGSPGLINSDGTSTFLGLNPRSINNFGQVAGNQLLYTPGTGTVQVPSLLPLAPFCSGGLCDPWNHFLQVINGLNDAGQMSGTGRQEFLFTNSFAVWFKPVTNPLSAFQAKLQITGKGETHFHLRGSFGLATDSNGFDPLTQPVLLQIGSLPIAIRKGSFSQDSKGDYVFQGIAGTAAVDFRISPVTSTSFSFRVEARTGRPFPVTNPARFIFMIGNNEITGMLPWK